MDMRGHNSRLNSGNWIAISRDMRDHPVVGMGQPVTPADPSRGSYSRYEAWQDLLMEAQFKPAAIRNKGKIMELQRGDLMAARAWLAKRWNWSEKTVRIFLDRLETEFMIRREHGQRKGQRSGHYSNIVSICNYDVYQTVMELMELAEGQSRGQSRASQGPESNKETMLESPNGLLPDAGASDAPTKAKRVRKPKSPPEAYTHDFDEFWKLYPRREAKAAAFEAWQRLTLPQKRRAYAALKTQLPILTARAKDRRGNYCPYPGTWINQGRFDDEPTEGQRSQAQPDREKVTQSAWLRREMAVLEEKKLA